VIVTPPNANPATGVYNVPGVPAFFGFPAVAGVAGLKILL